MSEQPMYPPRPDLPSAGQPAYPPAGPYPPASGYPNGSPGSPASGGVPTADAAEPKSSALDRHGRVRTTRSGAVLAGLVVAAIILIALLVFVLQNLESVSVHYLGFHGRVPLGVALLLSAIAGLLLVSIPGTVRILQLRRAVKKAATQR
jgi:uncharacterized integral membrane protein